ncbi:MAG: DNA primase, partial [Erythrobacter cryptus]
FAFPPRPPRAARTASEVGRRGAAKGTWRGAPVPLPGLTPEARSRLGALTLGGQRQGLLEAVLAGLARHPQEIARHAEALARLARSEPAAAARIEKLFELAETLDSRAPDAICSAQGQPAPSADIRYAFLDEGTDPDDACAQLAEAVSLLVERPALEAALAATIARFDSDPEGSFAEQARLRTRLMAIEERLKAFGRRKAAAPDAPGASGDAAA